MDEDQARDMAKQPVVGIRGPNLAPAIVSNRVLRVARCHFKDVFPNEALLINSEKYFSIVSLSQLDSFDAGSEITVDSLVQAKMVKAGQVVKVLANGEISKSLTVKVDKVSAKAKELIEGAGGSVVTSEPVSE